MIDLQNVKKVIALAPITVADPITSAGVTSIDTLGYDYAVIDLMIGATNGAVSTLKVLQSDTSLNAADWHNATDVVVDFNANATTGVVTDVTGNSLSYPTNNSDNTIHTIEIDLRGKKRYLAIDVIGTANSDYGIAAMATLGRAKEALGTATAKGATTLVRA